MLENLNCNVNTFQNLENYFKTFKKIKPDSTALISNWELIMKTF